MAAHFGGSRAAGRRLRQGRRGTGRGRDQSAGFGVDRAPAAAARPGRGSRHPIFRRSGNRKAAAYPAGDRAPRRRCAGAVGFARGGLDLQHPRRRRLAYAAAAVLCAGAEGRPPHRVHRSPQTVEQRARPSRTVRRCRGAGCADAQAHRTGARRRLDRARQRHRRRRAEPPDSIRRAARRSGATIPSACSRRSRTPPRSPARDPRIGAMRWRWRDSWPGSTARRRPAR